MIFLIGDEEYFYKVPNDGLDYSRIINFLYNFGIVRYRINNVYTIIYSKKRIKTKLNKLFENVMFDGFDEHDRTYMYKINTFLSKNKEREYKLKRIIL